MTTARSFESLLHAVVAVAIALLFALSATSCASSEPDYSKLREQMVLRQIALRGIEDGQVLEAMRKVPRHMFVPPQFRSLAYEDRPLPIGEGQTISQPYIVALMTESLGETARGKVLEIGTGSGYQAAVLAQIADTVFSIEIVPALALRARSILLSLGYKNVKIRIGDGYFGWPEAAPFDAVIVTAAAPRVPEPLVAQLRTGGRIVVPVGENFQNLELYEKTDSGLKLLSQVPVLFVPMQGEIRK